MLAVFASFGFALGGYALNDKRLFLGAALILCGLRVGLLALRDL
jgi:hypothetical protein